MKKLVIVESPAKARTLEKFLGKDYKVQACGGHVRDLPANRLGVDIDADFKPTYVTIKNKKKIIKKLTEEANKANAIYLAPDPDREGEAIAWHLKTIFGGDGKIKRIEFNEITKTAILEAVKDPREIDQNRVNAQQTRRILDRIVGYKLSPLLWKKIRKGLSAGRVQSIAVKLICEREKAINAFKPQEYWSIIAEFKDKEIQFQAKLFRKETIKNKKEAEKIVNDVKGKDFIVKEIKIREQKRNPAPPFITSTMQQEAVRKLGFSARKTMTLAQQLYEGVDLKKEGRIGLITYMRTDSVRIAKEAQEKTKNFIESNYGKQFLPSKPRIYKTKKQAQDAHEAIRPTYVIKTPQEIKDSLTQDQFKLYQLIWNRFVASQMASALTEIVSVDIGVNSYIFRATGTIIKFKGFMTLYSEEKTQENLIPQLINGQKLTLLSITPKQHFTEPPPRYTEASLIKELEEKGIGRPSTYAPILSTISERGYVTREGRSFMPTELGNITNEQLVKHFPKILNVEFTAHMEDELDDIVAGKIDYLTVLKEFYSPFAESLDLAHKEMKKIKKEIMTDKTCPKCGKKLVIRSSRYGDFYACTGFPKCRYTKTILKPIGVKCPREDCNGELVERRTRKGKIFYSCSNYPKCKIAFWQKPTGERCPKCNSYLVERKSKNKTTLVCSNKECKFKKDIKEEK